MASFHKQVSLDGFNIEPFIFTFKLNSGITVADIGKAVSMDGTTANRVKLSADTDAILGRLETYDSVTQTGAVALKFIGRLPVKSGETVVVGGSVQGAGSGEVKPLAYNKALNTVVEVGSGYAVVIMN